MDDLWLSWFRRIFWNNICQFRIWFSWFMNIFEWLSLRYLTKYFWQVISWVLGGKFKFLCILDFEFWLSWFRRIFWNNICQFRVWFSLVMKLSCRSLTRYLYRGNQLGFGREIQVFVHSGFWLITYLLWLSWFRRIFWNNIPGLVFISHEFSLSQFDKIFVMR